MQCPACSHELETVDKGLFWCARCGTLVSDRDEVDGVTDAQIPKLALRCRDLVQSALPGKTYSIGTLRTKGIVESCLPEGSRPGPMPRARDPIFDVVAEVTGSDPKVSGSHIARVANLLKVADPPYTVEEIRRFAVMIRAQWRMSDPPALGTLEKYIGRIRMQPTIAPAEAVATIADNMREARAREEQERQAARR